MVKLHFILSIIFAHVLGISIGQQSSNYKLVYIKDSIELKKNNIAIGNPIDVNWISKSGNPYIFYGIHQNDTLIKIISTVGKDEELIFINRRFKLSYYILKKSDPDLAIHNFPVIYRYKSGYVLEGNIAGCNGKACNPFYFYYKKTN